MQAIDNTIINAAMTQGDENINSKDILNDTADAEPLMFSKRIGSTTFIVAVHQSKTSRETAQDKVKRLIEREVRESA